MFQYFKKYSVFIIVGLTIIALFLFQNDNTTTFNELTPITNAELVSDNTEPLHQTDEDVRRDDVKIVVDIKGSVHHPGVYELDEGSRVHDAIMKAGGFTEGADDSVINLAQKLFDEMSIYVPERNNESENRSQNVSKPDKIRINYATIEEIQSLNGIGPSKAQAIINYREENGVFRTVDDLLEVTGIGKKTLENIMDQIQVP